MWANHFMWLTEVIHSKQLREKGRNSSDNESLLMKFITLLKFEFKKPSFYDGTVAKQRPL